ncbi:AMP-binding protein [bacterium]|nr:AMP-binding protein [bacterium]
MAKGALHSSFKLNGFSYNKETLKELAYDLIKEGEAFEKSIGSFLSDWLDDSTNITVQTSGSTGAPKQIQLEKQHMRNSAMATGSFFKLKPSDTALLCLSADYIAGKMMLVRAMVLGLHLDAVPPDSNPLAANKKEYDFAAMVPLQVENSLPKLHQLEKLIIGGAPVSYPLRQKLQLVKSSVFETYGMTETITHVALKKISSKSIKTDSNAQEPANFMALPNVTFSIDERDCLRIDAPKISSTQVVTNDIVHLISETEFEWLGRFDNVINSGGVKLHPERIEEKLIRIIQASFFITGLPDEQLGQKLVLVIEGDAGGKHFDTSLFPSLLEKYEIPKNVIVLPKFAMTANGKLNRAETARLIEQ